MAFYQFPAPTCALVAFAAALLLGYKRISYHVQTFANGIGEETVVLMCLIFLLAGAFAALTTASGSVNATVQLGLSILPDQLLLPGLFIAACLVSFAMGTSMGTIGTVAPIAMGMAQNTGIELPLLMGTVVGGAMFGDNLSIISDTTIAATSTIGCDMRAKMKANLFIALSSATIVCVALAFYSPSSYPHTADSFQLIKILPYALVLGLALTGLNVIAVLLLGIFCASIVGVFTGDLQLAQFGKIVNDGFMSMADVFFTTVLIAGLAAIAAKEGGLLWLLERIKKGIVGHRSAQGAIAIMVGIADICVANNTVAVLLTGKMAKQIAEEYHIAKGRAASILDIYACVGQGLIPHGAQLLLVSGLTGLSPFQVIPYTWYPMALFIISTFSIGRRRYASATPA